jgi:hypothetical protein
VKKCLKCGELKSKACFIKVSDNPEIYKPFCFHCTSQEYKKEISREKARFRQHNYYLKNRDEILNRQKEAREIKRSNDPLYTQKIRDRWQEWQDKHPEYTAWRNAVSLQTPTGETKGELSDIVGRYDNPVETKSELHKWMERNLTKLEYDVIQAYIEANGDILDASILMQMKSIEEYEEMLESARNKAKKFKEEQE